MGLFHEKDRMDGGKRMASNWEIILTPFLRACWINFFPEGSLQHDPISAIPTAISNQTLHQKESAISAGPTHANPQAMRSRA